MTLDEAMRILAEYKMQSAFNSTPEFEASLALGIEALKRLKVRRGFAIPADLLLLPSETK